MEGSCDQVNVAVSLAAYACTWKLIKELTFSICLWATTCVYDNFTSLFTRQQDVTTWSRLQLTLSVRLPHFHVVFIRHLPIIASLVSLAIFITFQDLQLQGFVAVKYTFGTASLCLHGIKKKKKAAAKRSLQQNKQTNKQTNKQANKQTNKN